MAKDDMQEFLNELDSYEKAGVYGFAKRGIQGGERIADNNLRNERDPDDESKLKREKIIAGLDKFGKGPSRSKAEKRGYIKKALDKMDEIQKNGGKIGSKVYEKAVDAAYESGLLETNKSTRNQISKVIKNINDPETKKEVASYTKEKLSGDSYEKSSTDSYSKE
ncbi:MAG: hypothetical protein ABEI74_02880 [Candidatus Pacearchaeota archaeon]